MFIENIINLEIRVEFFQKQSNKTDFFKTNQVNKKINTLLRVLQNEYFTICINSIILAKNQEILLENWLPLN
jgi:Txe/YoeB family toxin of Txe-Axe toxin-antitoxin module